MSYKHTKSQLYTFCSTLLHSRYHTLLTASIHTVNELVCLQTCQPLSQQTKECSSILGPTVDIFLTPNVTYLKTIVGCFKRELCERVLGTARELCAGRKKLPGSCFTTTSGSTFTLTPWGWINNLTLVWKIMFQTVNLKRSIMFGVQYSMTLPLTKFKKK